MFSDIRTIKDARDKASSLKIQIDRSHDLLKQFSPNLQSFETPKQLSDAIESLINAGTKNGKFYTTISDLILQAEITHAALEAASSNMVLDHEVELAKKNHAAKWDERNAYKIWAHKTLRWILGALLVVLLYSSAVWLQSKCNFIKIPVRDWIVNSQPKP